MKILVLGGTQFVGRHIVEAMVEADHKVSILNRGRSHDPLPAGVERLRGDRDAGTAGLEALRGRTWDVCVDVSGYTPRQVRSSTEILAAAAGHYVYISAVSVYGDPAGGPVDEDVPLLAPAPDDVTEVNGETYGPLKVACERIALDTFADRCTVLRPQIVAGPHDPFDRFSYWVRRASQDGVMLAPGDGSDFVQVIDARDVARFVRTVSEHRLPGSFNLAGDRVTWATFMAILGARRIEWVAADILAAAGLTFAELPLYRPVGGARSSLMNVGNERARRAGLRLTDLAETVRDVRRWLVGTAWSPALPPEREAALLSLARRGR
ncbi:MAG: NAD-dependent epimerase/dehydratase family protein [Phycisphaerales bacterium]|nr:NAD-dependent epimerase/dehydratase family protein [Phycisphaerales bacterium]